mmetsp:Transcript_43896/g.92364  ORF Transcript_43896/g.92364 Transcript_43896/m.92364 type:complete len:378 (-) Transcript_43896:332-1465(-)
MDFPIRLVVFFGLLMVIGLAFLYGKLERIEQALANRTEAETMKILNNKWLSEDTEVFHVNDEILKQNNKTKGSYFPSELAQLITKHHFNATMVDLNTPIRNIRDEAVGILHNWSFVFEEVIEAGHPICSLYRDNYLCVGERYKDVLRRTPLFNHSFDLNAFPPGSKIYIEGNSWMCELVQTITCNTKNIDVWLIGDRKDPTGTSNMFVKSRQSNVTLLLFINTPEIQDYPKKTIKLLESIHYIPDYIVSGWINKGELNGISFNSVKRQHRRFFTQQFPYAYYLEYFARHLPLSCRADFHNCDVYDTGHTCLPGPINAMAEEFVRALLCPKKILLSNWVGKKGRPIKAEEEKWIPLDQYEYKNRYNWGGKKLKKKCGN